MRRNRLNKNSLRWKMTATLTFGWGLPLVLLTIGVFLFAFSLIDRQITRTAQISAEKAVEICSMRLQEVETLSKNASYNQTIRNSYREYRLYGQKQKLNASVTTYLNQQYKYDASLLGTILFFYDEPATVYYTYNSYQDSAGGSTGYNRLLYFKEFAQGDMIRLGQDLDTDIRLVKSMDHLYMVRNLVDSSFRPYAMIILEINPGNIFGSLDSIWGEVGFEIFVDGEALLENGIGANLTKEELCTLSDVTIHRENSQEEWLDHVARWKRQKLAYVVRLDTGSVIDEQSMIRNVLLASLVILIPLIGVIFWFFQSKVTMPIEELTAASRKVAQGEYGYQLEETADSEEFRDLYRTFNQMSSELKYQFTTIYQEELALKDANIKALQSQINPHFLNNTLEIINWEARLGGNDSVSDMISALATMLSATLNRKQSAFVTLEEELTYVDAYLYIISRRFGDRFQVHRDIDESLLSCMVPILIIQPIVENAVEHGVEASRRGSVDIRIYERDHQIRIEIENSGNLTPADREKIRKLLLNEGDSTKDRHVSLGIRNVNQRLKIIYGENCGLTIENEGDGRTISTLTINKKEETEA